MIERKWISKEEAKKLYPNNSSKRNYYYAGIYFENECDFWEWVREYNSSQITHQTLDEIVLSISKDIILNIETYGIKINFFEMKQIMESCFLSAMKIITKSINTSANQENLHTPDKPSDSD